MGEPETDRSESLPTEAIPVVGIGASAGGLDALRELVGELPRDTGYAFVVVVHLAPERESFLAEILQRSAAIHVIQVRERVQMEANTMYVVSPGKQLSIVDGYIGVSDLNGKRWGRAPINRLLSTLGQTHPDGIGVILSGGGSDGTGGIRSLKENGGIVFVQDPDEAQYAAMPRSAIATGLADFVLPVRDIARKLVVMAHGRVPTFPLSADATDALERIFKRLRAGTGHDFSGYKQTTLLRRIQRRMRVTQARDLEAYATLLEQGDGEVDALLRDLLISVTGFYRDADTWHSVEQAVIPKLFDDKMDEDQVRIWVPGCATGEEAYGVAILALEWAAKLDVRPHVQIFASDVDEDALAVAREGRYGDAVVRGLAPDLLERYFTRDATGFRIKKEVRERILFTAHNLLRDPPFSKIDFVSCRNLLIYMRRDLQERVLDLFAYALRPGGFLLLGGSETADALSDLFRSVRKRQRIYQRRRSTEGPDRMPEMPLQVGTGGGRELALGRAALTHRHTVAALDLHRRALEKFGPPSVIVTESHEILHLSDTAGRFLCAPGGAPSHKLFRLMPKELRFDVRLALDKAFTDGKATALAPRVVEVGGVPRHVRVTVAPVGDERADRVALVTFNDSDVPAPAEGAAAGDGPEVGRLVAELESMREQLRTSIEDNDAIQEAMKAAHQELQSTNEEYKSTLEELETSKEELQSVNEELHTVNQELHHKIDEANQANADLRNLMESADAGMIFLDRDLNVERFTQQVGRVYNLMPRDRGRPLAHVTSRLVDAGRILEAASRVLESLGMVELELDVEGGEAAYVRVRPYLSDTDTVVGVVITVVDVTQLARARQDAAQRRVALEDSESRLRAMAGTLEQRVEERTQELLERTRQVRRLASELVFAEQRERHLLAQILHDDLQQMLYAVQMKIATLRREADPLHRDDWTHDLDETIKILAGAIDKTRKLSVDLSPPILRDEGLTEAIAWLVGQLAELYGLHVELRTGPDVAQMSQEMRVLSYQVVRELLFNVVKHARISIAAVDVQRSDDVLVIRVSDKGAGFDPATIPGRDTPLGFGLPSLRERVRFFGGKMEIASEEGKGTSVKLTIPTDSADRTLPPGFPEHGA